MVNGYSRLGHQLRSLASELGTNETGRFLCPGCGGGSSKEKSLVITAYTHHIVYHCFRAKCGTTGALSTTGEVRQAPKVKAKPRPYGGPLYPVPKEIHDLVFGKYELSPDVVRDQGITYAPEINRIRFPLHNYMGYVFGENLRGVLPEQKPKALMNKFNDVPSLHFPLGMEVGSVLVLVEDQISSIKVAQVHPCAALMGTNLDLKGLKQLLVLGVKKVILMLDGDDAGLVASVKLSKQLLPFMETANCILPDGMDPKDLPLVKLKEMIDV